MKSFHEQIKALSKKIRKSAKELEKMLAVLEDLKKKETKNNKIKENEKKKIQKAKKTNRLKKIKNSKKIHS